MNRAFRCKECGTRFTTKSNSVPPSPNWKDGHVCEMVEELKPIYNHERGLNKF